MEWSVVCAIKITQFTYLLTYFKPTIYRKSDDRAGEVDSQTNVDVVSGACHFRTEETTCPSSVATD